MPGWIGAERRPHLGGAMNVGAAHALVAKSLGRAGTRQSRSAGGQAEAPAKGWPGSVCESEGTSGFAPALLATGKCPKSSRNSARFPRFPGVAT